MPSDSLDNLFASTRGLVSYRDIHAAVTESIRSELHDLVVDAFRNLCRMTADDIPCLNPLCSLLSGGQVVVSNPFAIHPVRTVRKTRVCCAVVLLPSFSTPLGSTRREFLSDEAVCTPSGRMVTVREMMDEVSRNP